VKKIPTLFVRDWDGGRRYVLPEVTPGCEWVINGEGVATRKYDGTCVMFDGEEWWARREVKKDKTPPPGFVEIGYDDETGKTMGWEPVGQSAFAKIHAEAVAGTFHTGSIVNGLAFWGIGTHELIGPKINGNPEGVDTHTLIFHGEAERLDDPPRDFDGLAKWLHEHDFEGIVWHRPDGRMAKIKKRDFPKP
jgi:hypothetical protein